MEDKKLYYVKKRKHPTDNKEKNTSQIIYNEYITIKNIPSSAYDYIVNGKSGIAWIMDRYQIKTDKVSQITLNPNLYSDNPKYILNLLLSVISTCINANEIIKSLPKLKISTSLYESTPNGDI